MKLLLVGLGRDSVPTGVCRVAASHAKAVATTSSDIEVTLVVGHWQLDLYKLLLGSSTQFVRLMPVDIHNHSLARNYWFWHVLPRLSSLIGADIVHLSFPVPIKRRRFAAQIILTLHDMYPLDMPQNFGFPNYLANQIILKKCVKSVDAIACVSATTYSRLLFHFPTIGNQRVVSVVGNYVETFSHDRLMRPAVLTDIEPRHFILAVAQHRKNKNLDIVIRAFSKLNHEGKFSGPLVIVGADGPETPQLKALVISLNLTEKVRFVHSLSDPELHWAYAYCTAFVIASSVEGYCLPLAEALTHRIPAVCSDRPELRELGGSSCTYFSLSGKAEENLSDALTKALHAPLVDRSSLFEKNNAAVLGQYKMLYGHASPDEMLQLHSYSKSANASASGTNQTR